MAGTFRFSLREWVDHRRSLIRSINVRHTGNVIEEVVAGSFDQLSRQLTANLQAMIPLLEESARHLGTVG
jgi:hypothetical protein